MKKWSKIDIELMGRRIYNCSNCKHSDRNIHYNTGIIFKKVSKYPYFFCSVKNKIFPQPMYYELLHSYCCFDYEKINVKFMKNENLKLKLKNLKNELEKAIEYLEKELQSCPIEHKIELEEFRRKRGIAITKFFENGGTLEGLPNFIDKRKKFRGKIYEKRRQI